MTVMEPLPPDPYKALGVAQDAALSAIKTAYRKLALQCHPDKVLDPTLKAAKQDEFQRVQQAYEILSDETKKREYDDDVKLRKLREEVYKHSAHQSSAARPPPKNYYEYNVRTAEPPPSFRPGPPPAATARSPYATSNPHFSNSWDREIPSRSKPIYEEDRKPRRTASHEKASRSQEEFKDERRRRDKADDERDRRRAEREAEKAREREREKKEEAKRERQRERDRAEQRERERDREKERLIQEKEKRKAEEKRVKKERERERERAEKAADQLRKQQQEDKFSKKAAYVEHHDESDDNHRSKKASGSSSKKHNDSPRREKSGRREESPRGEAVHREKAEALLGAAADYMHLSRRKGSKSGAAGYYPDQAQQQYSSHSTQYRDPEEWRPSEGLKSRRPSHDDKYAATVEDDANVINVKPQADPMDRPPRLQKSYTSPVGQIHMSNTSAPRVPHLSRAATMDTRGTPPTASQAESSRHSKSDRRRRGSVEDFDDRDRPRRSMATHRMHSYQVGRSGEEEAPRVVYRQTDEVYGGGRAAFDKVKMQSFSHEPVYSSKRYQDDDIAYSNVPHSASYAQYGHARAYA